MYTNLVVKQLYTDVQLLNSLFQKAYGRSICGVASQKTVLDVSEAARMPLVPISKVFAGVFCTLLAFAERTRMSVVISSSELHQFTTSVL